jgi:hypothetical protein
MNYGKIIRFPMEDKDWVMKIIIGGILSLPILFFIAFGYEFKVMKNSINLKPEMPEWKGFADLFVKGIFVFIIGLLYLIIPAIIGSIGIVTGVLSTMAIDIFQPINMLSGILTSSAIGIFFIAALLMLIALFILPMAIAMYAKSDNFGDSFKFGEIFNRIKSIFGEYVVSYIILILLLIISGIIGLIPFIGWLLGLFATFYIFIVASNMFGQLYLKSKA